ncbi:HAD family hydrolase [Streptomonospora halophila]|uniref:HAD family hydrolase n=1 Tax=Streptomonospora halophila TaxID=427369 RepID=A0ABP9GLS5_9ACTN
MTLDLTAFRVLSFDCYGTLIDWEQGIGAVLVDWAREQGLAHSGEALLETYAGHEAAVMREHPAWLYPDVLAEAFVRTGSSAGAEVGRDWARRLGGSVGDWPAFPDSAEALARLRRHYDLVIVSNVHRDGFAGSDAHLRGGFTRIVTAEDVGAYKPADPHFEALDAVLDELGCGRDRLLHVAQSLFHDHVPARRRGLASVWINRRHGRPGWGATPEPTDEWRYDAEFPSMAAFADEVDRRHGD